MSAFFHNGSGSTVYYYNRNSSTGNWSYSGSISNGSSSMLSEVDAYAFTTNSTLSGGSVSDSLSFDEGVYVPAAFSVNDGDTIGTASTTSCGGSSCNHTLIADTSFDNPLNTTIITVDDGMYDGSNYSCDNRSSCNETISISDGSNTRVVYLSMTLSGGDVTSMSGGQHDDVIATRLVTAINNTSAGTAVNVTATLTKPGTVSGKSAIISLTHDSSGSITVSKGSGSGMSRFAVTVPSGSSDTTAPTVSSVAIASATGIVNNTVSPADTVSVNVVFSESVNVTTSGGTPSISIVVGSTTRAATYTSGSGSTTLVFNYTISSSDSSDTDGISILANSLALNGGTIKDAAGNNANLTHSAVAANASFKVDTSIPTIDFISTESLKRTYLKDDVIGVIVNFSEAVTLSGGNMLLNLNIPNFTRQIVVSPFSNKTQVTGFYTVQSGDNVDSLSISSISLSAGTISDIAGNNISDFSVPEGSNLDNLAQINIKTVVCNSGSVTKNSSDQIDSELVITRFESTSFDDCTLNQVPFRAAIGGAPALRGQKSNGGAFYHMFIGKKTIDR